MPAGALRAVLVGSLGRKDVSCTIPSTYAGGVKLTGSLKYTITLKKR
jgi:hypothetical protein